MNRTVKGMLSQPPDYTLILIYLFIPVDMIAGALIQNNQFNFAIIYKAVVLGVVFSTLLKRSRMFLCIPSIVVFYLAIHFCILQYDSASLSSSIFLMKFLSIVVYSFYFSHKIRSGHEGAVYNFIAISFMFLFLNQIAGVMGFGESAYGSTGGVQIGTKGFIYAGNELAIAIVSVVAVLLMKCVASRFLLKFILIGGVGLFMAASLANKTAVLAISLMLICFPIILGSYILRKMSIKKNDVKFIAFSSITVVLMIFLAINAALYYFNLYDKIIYFSSRLDTAGVIMSGRDLRFYDVLNKYSEGSIYELMFGVPLGIRNMLTAEIDPIDVLSKFGFLGVIFIYGSVSILLWRLLRLINKGYLYVWYVVFFILLLTSVSFIAGHVVFSGVAAPFLGVMIAYAFFKERYA